MNPIAKFQGPNEKMVFMRIHEYRTERRIDFLPLKWQVAQPSDIPLWGDNLKNFIHTIHTAKHVTYEVEVSQLLSKDGETLSFLIVHPSGFVARCHTDEDDKGRGYHCMMDVPADVLAHPEYNLYTDGIMYTISAREPQKHKPLKLGDQHIAILNILKAYPHGLTSRQILAELNKEEGYENVEMQSVSGRCSELARMGKIMSGGKAIDEVSKTSRNVWIAVKTP